MHEDNCTAHGCIKGEYTDAKGGVHTEDIFWRIHKIVQAECVLSVFSPGNDLKLQ